MASSLDRTLAALADPTRRAVVRLLRHKPLRPSEIAEELSSTRPAMSRHLRILRRAGLVEQHPDAHDLRARAYQLRRAPFSQLRSWIDQVEQLWTVQLSAFKAHAERRR